MPEPKELTPEETPTVEVPPIPPTIRVTITRTSGPCTDKAMDVEIPSSSLNVLGDVLAAVNEVANRVEGWIYMVDGTDRWVRPLAACNGE